MSNLMEIPGVGSITAQKLEEAGVDNVDAVAGAAVELLVQLNGFYEARAAAIRDAARQLAGESLPAAGDVSPERVPSKKAAKKLEKKAKKLDKLAASLKKAAKKARKAGKPAKAKKAKKAASKAAKKAGKLRKKS